MAVTSLPPRPACFRQAGLLQCTCGGWESVRALACISARIFWCEAQAVADMPDNEARASHIRAVSCLRGKKQAEELRAAAWELLQPTLGLADGGEATAEAHGEIA